MKILIPVDGSAHANAALDFVASRTTLLGLDPDIQLLNVQPPLSARVVKALGRSETNAHQRAQADDVLHPALERLQRAGIDAKASYASGQRADAVGAVAARSHSDLIVLVPIGRCQGALCARSRLPGTSARAANPPPLPTRSWRRCARFLPRQGWSRRSYVCRATIQEMRSPHTPESTGSMCWSWAHTAAAPSILSSWAR